MTDFFETRVENLEPKEDKKKSTVFAKKTNKKSLKKHKWKDSDFSVVESSEESSVERRLDNKHCILHGKCSHPTYKCMNLRTMKTSTISEQKNSSLTKTATRNSMF